ncbi:hypothetical protein B0H16DRAFT_1714281 [Mycena metata]|uniref:Transmembrane protein n=1 Tax=Mycena metata TaxID=1033252 RepID=A0AAD7K0Y4_9AGAR|nr:hypothetical protein B0H16DRAFT_1714281 [Mycena metata]
MLFVPVYWMLAAVFLSLTRPTDSPLASGLVSRGVGIHNLHTTPRHIPPLPRVLYIESAPTNAPVEPSPTGTIESAATQTSQERRAYIYHNPYFLAVAFLLAGVVLGRLSRTPSQVIVVVNEGILDRSPPFLAVPSSPEATATPLAGHSPVAGPSRAGLAGPSRAGPSSPATPPGSALPDRHRRIQRQDTTPPRTPARGNGDLYSWMAETLATRLRPRLHSVAPPTPVQPSSEDDVFTGPSFAAVGPFADLHVRRVLPSPSSPSDLLRSLVLRELGEMEREAGAASDGEDDSDDAEENEQMGAGAVQVGTSTTESVGVVILDGPPISVLEGAVDGRQVHSRTASPIEGAVAEAMEVLENPARVSVLERARRLDEVTRAKGKGKEVEEVKPDPVITGKVRAFIKAWVHAAPEREPTDQWLQLRGVQEDWAGDEYFEGANLDSLDM